MTESGTCVPAGPSRNAVGPARAGKRARIAATPSGASFHAASSSRSRSGSSPPGAIATPMSFGPGVSRCAQSSVARDRLLERTEAQPGGDRLRRVHAEERGPVGIDRRREPERQVLERLDALLDEPALVRPDELGRAARASDALEQLAERQRLRGPDRVEDAREPGLGRAEDPVGEIAGVDELHRLVARLGRERLAARGRAA